MTAVFVLAGLLMSTRAWTAVPAMSAVPDVSLEQLLLPQKRGWLGADVDTSIPLTESRLLWLFGDTIVGTLTDQGARKGTMVRNSIGIQDLVGDSSAAVQFYWDMRDNVPGSFFMAPNYDLDFCYWPCSGLMVDDELFVFCYKVVDGGGGVGAFAFKVVGTILIRVANPLESPRQWVTTVTELPFGGEHQGFCSAVIQLDNFVYLIGFDDGVVASAQTRQAVLARIRVDDLKSNPTEGHFQYWVKSDRDEGQWSLDKSSLRPILPHGFAEGTVYFDNSLNAFVMPIQTFFSSDISIVTAPTLTGPWSEPVKVYEVPETRDQRGIFAYAIKGHPQLSQPGELVVSYIVNKDDFWSLFSDSTTYYPRFIRVHFGGNK